MNVILRVLAAILVISGIWQVLFHDLIWGIILIVFGLAVGPGGYSIFRTRDR